MRRIDCPADSHYSTLFRDAMRVVDSIEARFSVAMPWRWGGGTVMMLRHEHRDSKDIDLFIDDPQYLGFLNPELNDVVGDLTDVYVQQSKFLKLYLPQGEIDFVVAATLTANPVEDAIFNGRRALLETDVEIVAKKLWYRCDDFTGRDVFDLHWLIRHDPAAIPILRTFDDQLERIAARLALPLVQEQFENVAAFREPPRYIEVAEQLCEVFPTLAKALTLPGPLGREWNAMPAHGRRMGTITAVSEIEVIQHIGQGRHVVWDRRKLSGTTPVVDAYADISAAGKLTIAQPGAEQDRGSSFEM